MSQEKRFLSCADIIEITGLSKSKTYSLIRELNEELEKKGFLTVRGKVIKKLYSKVLQDTEALSSRFQGIKFAENMLNTNTQIKNDVSFLNQANNFMNFVQIPLRMSGHEGHGDLYVYKNNRKKIEDKDELKALLHLDMDNLGPMDVFVLLKANNVTTNFKVASDDILAYIEEHISELNERLNALGYSVTSTVTSDKEKYSFVKSVMEEEFPSVEIKRFSFDVRT